MSAVTLHAIVIERRLPRAAPIGTRRLHLRRARPRTSRGVTVSLCSPPPLERPLTNKHDGDERLLLRDGETILADAQANTLELDPPPHVELAAAHAAQSRCRGFAHHPFPTCFGCGPNRAEG